MPFISPSARFPIDAFSSIPKTIPTEYEEIYQNNIGTNLLFHLTDVNSATQQIGIFPPPGFFSNSPVNVGRVNAQASNTNILFSDLNINVGRVNTSALNTNISCHDSIINVGRVNTSALNTNISFHNSQILAAYGNSISTNLQFSLISPDNRYPYITNYSPANGSTDAEPNANLIFTFSENIFKNTGTIKLYSSSGNTLIETYNIQTSSNITVVDNVLTINPTINLSWSAGYYVTFDTGVVVDAAGNRFKQGESYVFQVMPIPDSTAPTVVSTSPIPNSTVNGTSQVFIFNWSEPITLTGNVQLVRNPATVLETWAPAGSYPSSVFSITGSVVTINPATVMTDAYTYKIVFNTNSVKDAYLNGNLLYEFPFNISDATPPTFSSFSPSNNSIDINPLTRINVYFSEAILKSNGTITMKTSGGATIETFGGTGDSRLTVTGNRLTIRPSLALPANTNIVIDFAADAVTDLSGNPSPVYTGYTFKTMIADTIAPVLSSRYPINGSQNVLPADNFNLTFNEYVQWTGGKFNAFERSGYNSSSPNYSSYYYDADITVLDNVITLKPSSFKNTVNGSPLILYYNKSMTWAANFDANSNVDIYDAFNNRWSSFFGPSAFTTQLSYGDQFWLTPGTYSFTVPSNIGCIFIGTIGGGAAGANGTATVGGAGGNAGRFSRINNVLVTPGEVLTVIVGSGATAPGQATGESLVRRADGTVIVSSGYTLSPTGSAQFTTYYNTVGTSTLAYGGNGNTNGGGGGGSISGINSGTGGNGNSTGVLGGGGGGTLGNAGGGGGGISVYGNGLGTAAGTTPRDTGGSGNFSGADGASPSGINGGAGGNYGAGGGGGGRNGFGGPGASGAVRIFWGPSENGTGWPTGTTTVSWPTKTIW